MSAPVMQVRLRADYGTRCVLTDVRFDLGAGEALGLVGTSGAGKTTLAMAMLGLLKWRGGKSEGEVLIDGKNLLNLPAREARRMRGKRIALIPQSPMTALNAAVSLRAHFVEAWRAHEGPGRKALEQRLKQLMQEVQLPDGDEGFLRRRPGQISVGQAQRVLIALALLHRPSILVADEPTSALDPVTQAEIVKLLRQLNRRNGTALVYISHDLVSVLQLCERLAVLDAGAIAECLPVARIEQARHPATLSLLRALPVPAQLLLSHPRTEMDGDETERERFCFESMHHSVPAEMQAAEPSQLPVSVTSEWGDPPFPPKGPSIPLSCNQDAAHCSEDLCV
ncbi:MAG: ABC transporter ATP-binding protein [Terracidiphilus sp.]|jgi:ABC-type glutathione transport system ATPase component